MNYGKKLTTLALIIACGIVTECDNEKKSQGLVLIPSLLGGNATPVADAGPDQRVSILKGSVDLDGSESSDPEGKDLAYSWTVRYQPTGSNFSFSQPSGAATSFTFDTAGTYEILLTVNDGSASATDTVTVDVAVNNGPTADAGVDREVTIGDTLTLDGSGSSDLENDILTYTWTQIYGPTIGTGILTGSNPSITAPLEVCTIAYDLRVDDGSGDSFADRVYIFVMKKGGAGIYVATTGDDTHEGTHARPLKTIGAAMIAARSAGSDVYVSAGSYNESVTLADGVSLFGGFDPSTWERDTFKSSVTPLYTTTIQGGTIAVDGNAVNGIVVDGLTITSANATTGGDGSYGVRLINSTVELKNCIITAGNGAAGLNGSTIEKAGNGGQGGTGADGIDDCGCSLADVISGDCNEYVAGGAGSASGIGSGGGNGGNGINGENGSAGNNGLFGSLTLGGGGGAGGTYGYTQVIELQSATDGSPGSDGLNGSVGTNGTGGSGGSITGSLWFTSIGVNGGNGQHGRGGGGGGAGGGQQVWTTPVPITGSLPIFEYYGIGNGGGGGGAGGTGGTGGHGGGGGGASFGIFLNDSVVTITNCTITSGSGGGGGEGSNGGEGGDGGEGGNGGNADTDEVGAGGHGGHGGKGGTGGHGGGGAGGPSFTIYKGGWSSGIILSGSTPTLNHGSGGAGGASAGNPGAAGKSGYYGGVQ